MNLILYVTVLLLSGVIAAQNDTLFITADDEFLKVRLEKYSTEIVGDQYQPQQIIVLEDEKPFTGTVVKRKGVRFSAGQIFDSFYIDEEDESTVLINYRNGKFVGNYVHDDPDVNITFHFDEKGRPDGTGIVRIKQNNHWQKEFVPDIIPLITITNKIRHPVYYLELYDEALGKFDYQKDQTLRVRPNDEDLSALIDQIALPEDNIVDCYLLDSIVYSFQSGNLQDLKFNSSCGFEYKLNPDGFSKEMPVVYPATMGGEEFFTFDYGAFLFSPSVYNGISGGWHYYYGSILDSGWGRFFGNLDQLPNTGEIKTDNYHLKIQYDVPRIKQSAKRLKNEEVFYANPLDYGYPAYVYQIDDYFVKSFELTSESDNLNVHTTYTKTGARYYLESNFVFKGAHTGSSGSEYEYVGTLVTSGDLNSGIIDSISYNCTQPVENASFGTQSHFLLKRTSEARYMVEMEGRLAYDQRRKLDVTAARIEAVLKTDGSYKSLINDGEARFNFSDGSEKKYKYRAGEIIID